ncbi:MAG TPA: hypothetical protein VGM25_12495 [Caulobacteraceae bacterium]|jgi:DNA-binding NarL/FixJ family response regulator
MIRLTGEHAYRRERSEGMLAWNADAGPDFDLMEAFAAGFLLIDENLQIIRCNKAARRWLGAGADGFVRLLVDAVEEQSLQMRRQVRDAVVEGVRTTLLLKPTGQEALICSLMPIREVSSWGALVALTPLMGGSNRVIPHLRSLYKLSKAEAEIAAAAASGTDVVQMAEARKVSIHTLRAQIAAVKTKMGLSRMTEIAVAVGRIEAAVTWL